MSKKKNKNQKVEKGHKMFNIMSNASDINSKELAEAIIRGLDPDSRTLSKFISNLLEQYIKHYNERYNEQHNEHLRKGSKNSAGNRKD